MTDQEQDNFEKANQKYFDDKHFRTIIIGKDGIKNTGDLKDAIDELSEGKLTPEEREELLKKVKVSNPEKALLKAVSSIKDRAKKARLISVYWEIGLDCTSDFLFFVKQACEGDYLIAMECLTVIETIENEVPAKDLTEAQQLLSETINKNLDNAPMLEEILVWVEGRRQ
jgi:hypothetical protein